MQNNKQIKQSLDILNFGSIDAENDNLLEYFYFTPVFEQILGGNIDLILGPKGAGKSAIFRTMVDLQGFCKGIEEKYLLPINDPNHFIQVLPKEDKSKIDQDYLRILWKVYLSILIGKYLIESPTLRSGADILKRALIDAGFSEEINQKSSIGKWILKIIQYPHLSVIIDGIEYRVGLSSIDQEPTKKLNVSEILYLENKILTDNMKDLWVLIDKLDEILPGAHGHYESRNIALQALMNVHSDLSQYKNIRIKIFLRSDIYNNLSFVNKDHFSDKKVEISWDMPHLCILIAIRIASSQGEYRTLPAGKYIISEERAKELFNEVFDDLEIDEKQINNIEWMFNNLKDGTGFVSPRDLILLAIKSIIIQKDYNYRVINSPKSGLISQQAIIEAFKQVSKAKLNDYLYGIFPHVKRTFEAFRGVLQRKFSINQISKYIEAPDKPTLLLKLEELCELGTLEKVGGQSIDRTKEFIVPTIYLTALNN